MSEGTERPSRPPIIDDVDRPGPPPLLSEESGRSGRGLTIFIAVFALLAFAGVVWYAYDQGRQAGSDASAPLIRADGSPIKTKPEKAGGMDVPHQDKLVFQTVNPGDKDEGKVERLLPPPETPLPPAEVSKPVAAGSSDDAIPPAHLPAKEAAKEPESLIKKAPPPPAVTAAGTVVKEEPKPAPAPVPVPAASPAVKVEKAPAPNPAPPPAPKQPAPKQIVKAQPAPKPAPAAPKAPAPTAGNYRIQIAALRSEDRARALWTRVLGKNKDVLAGLQLTIEKITVTGKGDFFRVQGGSISEADARRICAELKKRNQACLVVRR